MIDPSIKALFETTPPSHIAVPATRAAGPLVSSAQTLSSLINQQRPLLKQDPISSTQYFQNLERDILPGIVNLRSTRFIGHMTAPLPLVYEQLGDYLISWNQNLVKLETSGLLTCLEMEILAELHALFFDREPSFYQTHSQNPEASLGMVTTGGTLANIAAMWVARNCALSAQSDPFQAEKLGLSESLHQQGYEKAVIIGSELMHYSFDKAADLSGLGTHQLIKIPVDSAHQLRITALKDAIRNAHRRHWKILAIVGIAGTTDSGTIDPLKQMAEIARHEQIWFHVDAAWGGPFIFSPQTRPALDGIELADSITIDGHKQLYTPLGIGCLLFADPHAAVSIQKNAPYILREGAPDLGKRSLEGSRPANSLYIHAAFQMIGRSGYQQLVEHGLANTLKFADLIRHSPDFQLLIEPQTNILLYRFIPLHLQPKLASDSLTPDDQRLLNDVNTKLQDSLREQGHSFVSRTTLSMTPQYGRTPVVALRAILANPLTEEFDLQAALCEQVNIGQTLSPK